MNMSDKDLTHQEEELSLSEFESEERQDGHDFGNWPEVAGLVFTIFVAWLIFFFRG
jgi:hypothetical protein